MADRKAKPDCRGFSLIEVNIALLVVSIGLAALLGLFPVGMRESMLASSDTTQALFATRILNAVHANAGAITTWKDWQDATLKEFVAGITVDGQNLKADGSVQTINKANGIEGNVIRYTLTIGTISANIRYAAIRVADSLHSDITTLPLYYTEFRFGCN